MKYQLVCKKCGKVIGDFATWFQQDQKCSCGSTHAEVEYGDEVYQQMKETRWSELHGNSANELYFDFLPLMHRENIVTRGEGAIPIERWEHMERFARDHHGIDCQVFVYRNDLNGGSGTFKDISAALAASVMKEHDVKGYCLASTGNAASAYATYLHAAGIPCHVFSPQSLDPDTVRFIHQQGQPLHISNGNYGVAKKEAADFHEQEHVMISAGNIDPLRVEAKRTMVFEFLRQLGGMPDVFMQAVAGGTGPIALEKGIRDLRKVMPEAKMPRMVLAQQDLCDPMVRAWEKAVANQFPEGYEHDFEALKYVTTRIAILTAANPGMYPLVAPMVRQSGGTFVRVKEAELPAYGKEMLCERNVLMGPAAMVCYAGFYEALKQGAIRNGDRVVLNTGEGCERAQWYKLLVSE